LFEIEEIKKQQDNREKAQDREEYKNNDK